MLADVGLAKEAAAGAQAQTHFSTHNVQGTAGYLDPLIVNGLQHSTLTDGYAMGITMLVALTGQSAVGLKARCRMLLRNPEQPTKWQPPGVPDAAAGEWPTDVATRLAAASAGLTEEYAEDRMRLAEVLQTLETIVGEVESEARGEEAGATVEAASVSSAAAATTAAADGFEVATGREDDESRECMVCMSAPRQVRFLCGHRCMRSGQTDAVVPALLTAERSSRESAVCAALRASATFVPLPTSGRARRATRRCRRTSARRRTRRASPSARRARSPSAIRWPRRERPWARHQHL